MTTERRSTTDSRIEYRGEFVLKSGNGKVVEQAKWLLDHASEALPEVFEIREQGYLMRRLHDLPLRLCDPVVLASEVVDVLRKHVWSRPAVVKFDGSAHLKFVRERAQVAGLSGADLGLLYSTYHGINFNELAACLTHGDPTFDNVMLRDSEPPESRQPQLVLIDPNPATPHAPDLLCVDLGWVVLSLMGYEYVRYGKSEMTTAPTTTGALVATFALKLALDKGIPVQHGNVDRDNEQRAVAYFAAVNALRARAYLTDNSARVLDAVLLSPLLYLLHRKWVPR